MKPRKQATRGVTSALLQVLLAALLLWVVPTTAEGAQGSGPIALTGKPVQLDPDDPGRTGVGRLVWRGGLRLSSPDRRFGGFSGLLVSPDGDRLLAVSDTAHWLAGRLTYDGKGRLAGLEEAEIGRLLDPDGTPLSTRKRWGDAESLAALADGSILASFETRHRIWRYLEGPAPLAGRPTVWPQPDGLDGAPGNGGLEALVALSDGRLLGLTEEQAAGTNGADAAGYLWQDGAWSKISYRRGWSTRPTGATRLPGGDLLVLERGFSLLTGPTVRLVRVPLSDVRPGARLAGEELARWGLPLTIDNFEAVAARRGPGGETLIYLLSDDNFKAVQRTLLLMFALEEGGSAD